MSIYRSALSASVIAGLPNVDDYIHKHRERLMEEKRLKLLSVETQRQAATRSQVVATANLPMNPMDIVE
jgi:kelch-like protein 10